MTHRITEYNRVLTRAKRIDTMMKYFITISGYSVIVCVLIMIYVIFKSALPLFYPPEYKTLHQFNPQLSAKEKIVHVGLDEHFNGFYYLDEQGKIYPVIKEKGNFITKNPISLLENERILSVQSYGDSLLSIVTDKNNIYAYQIEFYKEFNKETIFNTKLKIEPKLVFENHHQSNHIIYQAFRLKEDESRLLNVTKEHGFEIHQFIETEDLLGNISQEEYSFKLAIDYSEEIQAMTLSQNGEKLWLVYQSGLIELWNIADLEQVELRARKQLDNKLADGGSVFGDNSFLTMDEKGFVKSYSAAQNQSEKSGYRLVTNHQFYKKFDNPQFLYSSVRNKSFMIQDDQFNAYLYHLTTEKELLQFDDVMLSALSPNSKGLITLNSVNQLSILALDIPHPEISFSVLFQEIFYENFDSSEYIWQSSAGNDDYEPKFSFIPLIFGTFKGTLYAMLFSIPLALFAAIYTSYFIKSTYRTAIKSTIEIMSAVPSVVIGFIAALWFAPVLEQFLFAFFLSLFLFPFFFFFYSYALARFAFLRELEFHGKEFINLILFLVLYGYGISVIAPLIEPIFFDSDLQSYLYDVLSIKYEQRNAIVISFALGFAVMPIIYTVSDDALSNIPKSYSAASLALGATRWQTMSRIILPAALPGVLSALIIGLGRAIGETMIVLMATGNTPLVDLSLFNGMRTLSANIAVEIPEAPFGDTLYRLLFLTATLLFIITSLLNTLAVFMQQSARKKLEK